MNITKSNTKKDEYITKQIKYRRKLFFNFAIIILLWSHGVLFNNILKKQHKTQ
jgi:hypothetical protein